MTIMTDTHSRVPESGHGYRGFTAAASLVVGALFFALWFWLLPQWLGFSVEMAGAARRRWPGGGPVGVGICCCSALRLGFRMDGPRHPCSVRSAAAIGGGGFLPLRAESYVRGFGDGMDWPVGDFRASQPGADGCHSGGCSRRTCVRGLL